MPSARCCPPLPQENPLPMSQKHHGLGTTDGPAIPRRALPRRFRRRLRAWPLAVRPVVYSPVPKRIESGACMQVFQTWAGSARKVRKTIPHSSPRRRNWRYSLEETPAGQRRNYWLGYTDNSGFLLGAVAPSDRIVRRNSRPAGQTPYSTNRPLSLAIGQAGRHPVEPKVKRTTGFMQL